MLLLLFKGSGAPTVTHGGLLVTLRRRHRR